MKKTTRTQETTLQTTSTTEEIIYRYLMGERELIPAAPMAEMEERKSPKLSEIIKSEFAEEENFSYHVDSKKKKVMVRWTGSKMLFKVFIQRGKVKVHLKYKEDWEMYTGTNDYFYQNGFNLPFAVKMDNNEFVDQFLPWVHETYLPAVILRNTKAK